MMGSKIVMTVIVAAALSLASGLTPAEARWGGARHSGWSNAAIAAGIGAGLALAAAAASSGPYYSGYGYYPYGYGGYGYRGRCFSSGAYC
jgi:multisubunit Na+/H+ antiporter MnhB subunit